MAVPPRSKSRRRDPPLPPLGGYVDLTRSTPRRGMFSPRQAASGFSILQIACLRDARPEAMWVHLIPEGASDLIHGMSPTSCR